MIENLIDCQTKLIAALDARDGDAILSASHALQSVVDALRQSPIASDAAMLALGLKQTEAARIRVKYLTAWNRQKIDRLADLRGQSSGHIYAKRPESG